MNRKLIRPVSEQEISHAVNSMHPNKSPGLDGMSPFFFQKFWHVIRKDVINAVHDFFHSGHILKSINETMISLIPKSDSPTMITRYRPIGLCNVIYKIISKALINRFKTVLDCCISPSQSVFVPGR